MAEFKQRSNTDVKQPQSPTKLGLGKKRKIPWVFALVLLVTVFLGIRSFEVLAKKRQANKMNRAYEAELAQLADKEIDLQAELTDLATEAGMEQEIREKFRVTKEGEELVVIVPQKKTETDTSEGKGLFSFLRNLFK